MTKLTVDANEMNEIIYGQKTIEGVLGTPEFLRLSVGDTLEFQLSPDSADVAAQSSVNVTLTQTLYFISFDEMFDAVDYEQVAPSATDLTEAIAQYKQRYTADDETEYGVVALYFELTDNPVATN